ncbi:GGDEF domain-containing protein [Ectobacillus ponti]|uniref:Diguanylate cyclase n=1 Tax=Ectobacillus ponti TaxID=2961894 RepID=A0AA41X6R9_9BACI|nr:GGDEF domain-containing protein [Ectobacillus ponti]MCP8967865.1 diguanylate cyclase [Ectobacillus ponti]
MFRDILVNVFIILAAYLLVGNFTQVQPAAANWRQQLLLGFWNGVLGIVLILYGINFLYMGISLDLRHIPIVMAATFLNVRATLLTAAVIAAARAFYPFNLVSLQAGLMVMLAGIGSAVIRRFVTQQHYRAILSWIWSVSLLSAWYYHLLKQNLSVSPPLFFLNFWGASALTGLLAYFILRSGARSQKRDHMLQDSLNMLREKNVEISRLATSIQVNSVTIEQKNRELQEANQQVTEILESIQEIFLSLDTSWRYIYINRKAEPFLGRTREDLLGKGIWEEFPNLRGTAFEEYYRRTMEARVPCEFEEYFEPRGGWFEVRTYPSALGITVYIRDITERKILEQKLQEQNLNLQELVYHDALTGVRNRRFFDMILHREWAEACHSRRPLALMMMDIDYFKPYNDHFGHDQGDACLRAVAQQLHETVRHSDYTVRYGGEEFAVLMPNTSLEEALLIAKRVNSSIRQMAIPHPRSPVGIVTVSIGAKSVVPNARTNVKALLQGADAALYQAKEAGRNQVMPQ